MDEASTRKAPRRAAAKKAVLAKAGKPAKAAESKAAAPKVSPLAFMLMLMRDEAKPAALRLSAARAAAPYVHGRYAGEEPEGGESRLRESLKVLVDQAQEWGGGVTALVRRR
ncbi:MAG TPA: hypothetical protein VNX47_09815 [Nevskia sp.]|jgi:hypothetical protein|nr:hypothetical protein [Nevskia sp.]